MRTSHITIIDNSFSDIKRVDKQLKKFSQIQKPFLIKIKGIDSFAVKKKIGIKKYSHKDSLIYLIENNNSLVKIRKNLLKQLNHLTTKDRLIQWLEENPYLSKRSLDNIKKYGTPFGLKEWKFHVTIGLISKEKKKNTIDKIKKLNIQESFIIDHIELFIRKNGWTPFKKYPLKRKNPNP